jgi:uncharacterized protein (DUF1330 family)
MAAYLVAEVTVHDNDGFAQYRDMAPPSVAAYGGKYLARGGAITSMEGNWQPSRITVTEFPSVEQAKAWWNSPEYAEARDLRQRTATTKMIIVEGV